MRNCSSGVLAALASGKVHPFYMVDMQFTSGHSYMWTGYGSISWNGHTWVGLGNFGGVGAIQESNIVQADNVTLNLNGVPSALISEALNECSQQYKVRVYLGFLDDSGALITDPVKCFDGNMDVPTVQDGADTCSIAITAENLLVALQRASNRRYTKEDQRIDFATDKGFDYVPSIQDWSGIWGRPTSNAAPPVKPGLLTPYYPHGANKL